MITKPIAELLKKVQEITPPDYLTPEPYEPLIEVDEIVSYAAKYYEKVRNAVDYKEEHLIRRGSIERILKRRLTIDPTLNKLGKSLIVELIQAGYLPNNTLPESISLRVQLIIDKIVYLKKNSQKEQTSNVKKILIDSRILNIVSTEIESFLYPDQLEEKTVMSLYSLVRDRIDVKDSQFTTEDVDVQVFLACWRAIFKKDESTLFYKLWLMYYPEWIKININNDSSLEYISEIAENFNKTKSFIEQQLHSSLQKTIAIKLRDDAIFYSFIFDIIKKYPKDASTFFEDPETVTEEIKYTASKKYKVERSKIKRSSIQAIIYIFVTKFILAIIIELPYDLIVEGSIQYLSLIINIIFHPLLLFFVTRNIFIDEAENTRKIIEGVKNIVYTEGHSKISILSQGKKNILTYTSLFLYLGFFIVTFSSILFILEKLHFNLAGIIMFMFFLTLISYFALRIRYNAKKWVIRTNKQTFISFMCDILTLPIVTLGQWLSVKFASINVFVFILDFLIEAPFKILLDIFDSFTTFIKEKKSQIE